MPEDALTIGNRALGHCGARTVMTTLGENSNEARLVSQFFGRTALEVLSAARWNFASGHIDGTIVEGSAPPGWRYSYAFPAGALRINGVFLKPNYRASVPIFGLALAANQATPGDRVAYAVGRLGTARAIFCNVAACVITYSRAENNFDLWQPQAILALEYALAAKLAIPLSGDKQLAQILAQQADNIMAQAKLVDANDDISLQDIPVDWLLEREGNDYLAELGNNLSPTNPGGGGGSGEDINVFVDGGLRG